LEPWVAIAVEMEIIEERVGEGMSTPMGMNEEATAIADERRVVGVAFSREVGSKPGGGNIS
jgi:hypothetical protein